MEFEATLKALTEANVSFVVVGGYAAMLLGSAILTQDLDICYERTPENMERLVSALRPYHPRLRGAPPDLPFVFDAKTFSQGMNFTFQTDLGDVDLLGYIDGLGEFPAVVADAVSVRLFGYTCRVISLESLIRFRSKRATGRAKDLNALAELEALREMQGQQRSSNSSEE